MNPAFSGFWVTKLPIMPLVMEKNGLLFYFLPDPSRSAAPICSPSAAAATVLHPTPRAPSPFLELRQRGRCPPSVRGGELLRHERISHALCPGGAPHTRTAVELLTRPGRRSLATAPRGGAPTAAPPGGEIWLARLGRRAHVHRALVPTHAGAPLSGKLRKSRPVHRLLAAQTPLVVPRPPSPDR
jgi:hypothetical protein